MVYFTQAHKPSFKRLIVSIHTSLIEIEHVKCVYIERVVICLVIISFLVLHSHYRRRWTVFLPLRWRLIGEHMKTVFRQ